MKYFDKELINKISSQPRTDEDGEKWSEMCNRAYEAFIKASEMLLDNVVEICKNGFFHDWVIDSVAVKRSAEARSDRRIPKYDVVVGMELSDGDGAGLLIHRDAYCFNASVEFDSSTMFGTGRSYGYGEIYVNEENELVHNILLDDLSEINIVCKGMEWVEIGRQDVDLRLNRLFREG